MAKSKLVQINAEIADAVVGGFQKIEDTVVGGYRKIEDAFVDRYLTRDGESVEEAKNRLAAEQRERQGRNRRRTGRNRQTRKKTPKGPAGRADALSLHLRPCILNGLRQKNHFNIPQTKTKRKANDPGVR